VPIQRGLSAINPVWNVPNHVDTQEILLVKPGRKVVLPCVYEGFIGVLLVPEEGIEPPTKGL
jgi:hypothetical protein